jgi:predicted Rossmann-fold nucleotide-binding protein
LITAADTDPAALADMHDPRPAELGRALAQRELGLIYGGAQVGLMGAVANAVLAARGHVTGIIPEALVAKEVAHAGFSELRVVSMLAAYRALAVEKWIGRAAT